MNDRPTDNNGSNANDKKGSRTSRSKVCSFCGRSAREVGPTVEGPEGVQICAHCVDLCQTLIVARCRRVFCTLSPRPDSRCSGGGCHGEKVIRTFVLMKYTPM